MIEFLRLDSWQFATADDDATRERFVESIVSLHSLKKGCVELGV
jgi:hypothetical protein